MNNKILASFPMHLWKWDRLSPLMQTEVARLSIFMSLAGYIFIFSDIIFSDGFPSFERLLGDPLSNPPNPNYFLIEPSTKWRCTYFAFAALLFARLLFIVFCPKRLEYGFRKADFVHTMKSIHIKSEVEAMFVRVAPSVDRASFETKRRETLSLLFPDFDHWRAFRLVEKNEIQPAEVQELQVFLSKCLEDDFDLAVSERQYIQIIVFLTGVIGYFLLAIPALDLFQAVFRVSFMPIS